VKGDRSFHSYFGDSYSLRAPSFLSLDNFEDIILNISILAIVALAQTMVILRMASTFRQLDDWLVR
jgi:hypothetical protein